MKKLIFLLLILSYVALPQKSVLTQKQRDSIRVMIGYLNVKDYGAVGDGITDDRQAFIDAIAGLGSYGGTVLVGLDAYLISDSIIVPNGVEIRGLGKKYNYGSTIIMSDTTKNVFVFDGVSHCVISDLSIYGGNIGLKFNNGASYIEAKNIDIKHSKTGIYMRNALWNTLMNIHISDIGNTDSSMIGVHIDGWSGGDTDYCNNNTFINVQSHYGGGGLLIERGQGNVFLGCNFEGNRYYGIKIDNKNLYNELVGAPNDTTTIYAVGGHSFYGTWIENVRGSAIWIEEDNNSTFYNTTILNTYAKSGDDCTLRIEWSNQTRFIGGTLTETNVFNNAFEISPNAYKVSLDMAIEYYYGTMAYSDSGFATYIPQIPQYKLGLQNLVYNSEDMTKSDFNLSGNATVSDVDTVNFPDPDDAIMTFYPTKTLNKSFRGSVTLSGSGTTYLYITDNSGNDIVSSSAITLSSTPTRYSVETTFITAQQTQVRLFLARINSATATSVTATKWQLEEITDYVTTNNSLWK